MELGELPELGSLGHAVSNNAILRLGTGAGDDRLTLGRPGHQVAAEEDGVAGGGASNVRTPDPVGVSVDDELSGGRLPVKEAEVDGAAEVAKDPLESSEVWLPGIMHMEADLLNCIGDVRPGEGEVHRQDSDMQWDRSLGCPRPLIACPACQPEWNRACTQSS